MSFPVLTSERLVLRAPSGADQDAILAFLMSDRAGFYGGPMPKADAWQKFSAYAGQWLLRGTGMFAITRQGSGETIGMAGPYHPAHFAEPEMSWLIAGAGDEGRGFAREACDAVLHHLFADLGWSSVVSYIDPANTRSLRLAERLGATPDPAPAAIAGCVTYRHTPVAEARA